MDKKNNQRGTQKTDSRCKFHRRRIWQYTFQYTDVTNPPHDDDHGRNCNDERDRTNQDILFYS